MVGLPSAPGRDMPASEHTGRQDGAGGRKTVAKQCHDLPVPDCLLLLLVLVLVLARLLRLLVLARLLLAHLLLVLSHCRT